MEQAVREERQELTMKTTPGVSSIYRRPLDTPLPTRHVIVR